jgi:hypothetical protein
MHVFSNAAPRSCQRPTFKHITINLGQVIRLPSHGTALRHDLCTQDILFINVCQNHGLHRVHHKHSESPDRTCECRQLSRNPTLSHADLTSLGPSFYSIYRAGWRTAHHMPAQKVFLRHLYSIFDKGCACDGLTVS